MHRSSSSLFFAGLLLTNSVPHFATAMLGRPQITPFGRDSSPQINLVWAALNVAGACVLLLRAGRAKQTPDAKLPLLPLEAGCLFWGLWMTGFDALGIWLQRRNAY